MQQIDKETPKSDLIASKTSCNGTVETRHASSLQPAPAPASALELRAYLDTSDTKCIAEAIIKADVRKVEQLVKERNELELQLVKKRKDYKWWVALFASPELQAETLATVQKAAELLKEQMAMVPVLPTLREVANEHGERASKMQIVGVITWADGQINTGHKLTSEQIVTIASAVLEAYGGLRIEDVTTCIKQHVLHASGPVMRLDTQVVMSWFHKYTQERLNRIEIENYNRHLASK